MNRKGWTECRLQTCKGTDVDYPPPFTAFQNGYHFLSQKEKTFQIGTEYKVPLFLINLFNTGSGA